MTDGNWAREVGDSYTAIALTAETAEKAEANSAEAMKYYGIAARLDRIQARAQEAS